MGGNREMAIAVLRKRWHVYPDSEELTPEGMQRDRMGAEGRAMDRAAKQFGGNMFDYTYDYDTNKARK
jgi:hypothetical protein